LWYTLLVGRTLRTNVKDCVYHILNRANAKAQIFETKEDYQLFEKILEEAVIKFNMRLLAYCLMPNHWHLVLYPKKDGDLSKFMNWLTLTHTQRWHARMGTTGQGHLYQGRYKSFICQEDAHFITLVRYVERNAKKANLSKKVEDWQWSSVWRREQGTVKQKSILSPWPVARPRDYLEILNEPLLQVEEDAMEKAEQKGRPYGDETWTARTVANFGLQITIRNRGRQRVNKGS